MTKKTSKTKEDKELYDSLKIFVEKIIEETDKDKFSKDEISGIISDLLPNIETIIERKVKERLGDINQEISKGILLHLNFLADKTSEHIKEILNSLHKGG